MNEGPGFTIFLDANVLAKPVTRTLLMIAGDASGYGTTWSASVEDEANRHLRPGQTSVAEVRVRAGLHLSEPGADPERYPATSVSDRQVLADAVAAQAMFIVTEDVDDFGEPDLVSAGIAAVNPDIVAAGCPACMMQISDMLSRAGDRIAVKHPIELYAQSLKEDAATSSHP